MELVDRLAPSLCLFGHIHEARGTWRRGRTTLVNAAAVDVAYAPVDEPFVLIDV